MEQQKIDKKQISDLQSDNSQVVLATINTIAGSGNSAYLPALISLMSSTNKGEVKERIAKLLAELKHSDAIPYIINAIQDKKYHSVLKELVSGCWENGLDFSPHLNLFVELVVEEDFLVAFEAFTVIENLESDIDDTLRAEALQKLKAALPQASPDKHPLLQELLEIIPKLPL